MKSKHSKNQGGIRLRETESRLMPKRFSINVPEPIYEALSILAKVRDKPLATLAAEVVEALAQDAIDSGLVENFKKLQGRDLSQLAEGFSLVDQLLTKCADGQMPTDTEITLAADHTTVSADELKDMCQKILNGNGHAVS